MNRRVIVFVLVLLLAVLAFIGYSSYDVKRAGNAGGVFSNDPPKAGSEDMKVVVAPTTGQDGSAQVAQPAQPVPQETAAGGDTISPNPPNGMLFTGAGRYQLYRQGNLTWRLNTETGKTCIIFATDEEWRKPRVYRAGCGAS